MNFQESQIEWLAAQNAYVTKKDQGDKVIIFDRANAIFGELHSDKCQGSTNTCQDRMTGHVRKLALVLLSFFQFSTSTTQNLLPIILLAFVKRVNTVLFLTRTEQSSTDTQDWNQVRNISRKNNLKINVIILSAFIYLLELVSFYKNATSQFIESNCELRPLAIT